jgi:hypothetical protein
MKEENTKIFINFGIVLSTDVETMNDILDYITARAKVIFVKKSLGKIYIREDNND